MDDNPPAERAPTRGPHETRAEMAPVARNNRLRGCGLLRLARSADRAVCPRAFASVRPVCEAHIHPRNHQPGRDFCLRGHRALGPERACAIEIPDGCGTRGRQFGGGRRGEGSAQARFRPHLAGDVGARQPVSHSRRRIWLQPVPRRAGVRGLSLRTYDGHLRRDDRALDMLSEVSGALWDLHRRSGHRSRGSRFPFPRRCDCRSVPRRLHGLAHGRAVGAGAASFAAGYDTGLLRQVRSKSRARFPSPDLREGERSPVP